MPIAQHVPNHQVVALAVFLLGGDKRFVDTEDVAVKANEIAPKRFTWRKYSDQINLEIIRVYLSDAKKESKGELLEGSGNEGWRLTAKGKTVAQQLASETQLAPSLTTKQSEVRQAENERLRLLATDAYQKHLRGAWSEISDREADAFFRVDDYVDRRTRQRKTSRILDLFSDDPELGQLALLLAERVKSHG